MQSFLQQKVPVTEATPQTKPLLQRRSRALLVLRFSAPSQSLSLEHSAEQSDVVSTLSALLTSRAGRRQIRVGHSRACGLTTAWFSPPSADSSQTRPMALSSHPETPAAARPATNRVRNRR